MHRYYRLDIQPELFGQWCCVRGWGRIGAAGEFGSLYPTPADAQAALDLPLFEYWTNDPAAANDATNFRQIKFDIDDTITEIKVRHTRRSRKTSVHLNDGPREKILELINKIELIIDAIDIPLARRKRL